MTNCTRLGKMMAKMGLFFSASLCRRRYAATLLYYGIRNGVKGFLKELSYLKAPAISQNVNKNSI